MRACRLSNLINIAAFSIYLLNPLSFGEEPAAKSERNTANNSPNEAAGRIKAGYGTDEWHIGMPLTEFGTDWERHLRSPKEGGYLINRKLGISASLYEDRVIGITFNYAKLPREAQYEYKTEKGIGPSDAIVDVESAYGEPSHIDMTPGDATSPTYFEVIYRELGIEFEFRNMEMANVKVSAPRNDFDYDHYRRSMKQWLVYIRQPPKK